MALLASAMMRMRKVVNFEDRKGKAEWDRRQESLIIALKLVPGQKHSLENCVSVVVVKAQNGKYFFTIDRQFISIFVICNR